MFTDSILAGIFFTLAAIFCLVIHFLLEPRTLGYPKAPRFLRIEYFGFGLVLLYLGLTFLSAWATGPADIPPQAQPKMVIVSLALVIHKGTMLFNLLRQHLPVATWSRLDSITERVRCSQSQCSLFTRKG